MSGSAALQRVEPPQHLQALQRANLVRLARADLKRRVNTGKATAADVILTCPWEVASMTIGELLCAQRRWGTTRCARFLAEFGVTETKTIGSMTERQRIALAVLLPTGPTGSCVPAPASPSPAVANAARAAAAASRRRACLPPPHPTQPKAAA